MMKVESLMLRPLAFMNIDMVVEGRADVEVKGEPVQYSNTVNDVSIATSTGTISLILMPLHLACTCVLVLFWGFPYISGVTVHNQSRCYVVKSRSNFDGKCRYLTGVDINTKMQSQNCYTRAFKFSTRSSLRSP